jgi:hypothetical protein
MVLAYVNMVLDPRVAARGDKSTLDWGFKRSNALRSHMRLSPEIYEKF